MSKIRAMVIDDSAFMRKVIKNLLQESGKIEVIDTARNGKDALDKLQHITPDVITLDVEMPIMNGIEFLEKLFAFKKIPVVMLSSLTTNGASETLRALDLGAVDFITKPSGVFPFELENLQSEIVEKVLSAAAIDVNKIKVKAENRIVDRPIIQTDRKKDLYKQTQVTPKQFRDLVAIGTSTGGPRALQEVLVKLPANFPAPILIVQHMPPGFTKSLAERLDALCNIRVVEATQDERVQQGVAYIAPGNYHMTLNVNHQGEMHIHLDKNTPPRMGHRPSVDVLFESIAQIPNIRKYIVIMTGMGSDGTRGLMAIKEKNQAETIAIAEHESTCVVYGMPRSAIQTGLTDQVVPLDQIGDQLTALLLRKNTFR